ncbi:MAG: hypothetical protein IT373_37370 [Polyangiaceae bacterium]|nr:hypothetical protein [Polyangiaceae bacterium]
MSSGARRALTSLGLAAATVAIAASASGWTENRIEVDDVRIELDRAGGATVEHRLHYKLNGSERQTRWLIAGVDPDAAPLGNSYVVPAEDAGATSLDTAVPLTTLLRPAETQRNGTTLPPTLELTVDPAGAMKRGAYVFVVRYHTELAAADRLRRDGAMVSLSWNGPLLDDGIANARATFVLPAAPNAPRLLAAEDASDEDTLSPLMLKDVRRTAGHDEIELLRAFAPKGESVLWQVRFDPRALDRPPAPPAAEPLPDSQPRAIEVLDAPAERLPWLAAGGALGLLYTLLVVLKFRQLARHAAEAEAELRPVVPMPLLLRAPLAGAALVAGVALELFFGQPLAGAAAVLGATALALHGTARARAPSRGPGRWLTVSVAEGVRVPPRPRGALVDVSTLGGKLLFALLSGGVAAGCYLLAESAPAHAWLVGLDGVALLALFGTGRVDTLPPDLALEPARLLAALVRRLKKLKGAGELRMAARIRMPAGSVDPDELRLVVAPRLPRRGFGSIEIGVSYALGIGARVAMPEVMLRFTDGSPCAEAVASMVKSGRLTPGRKPEERVLALTPRLPTVRMTAAIVAALAARVVERAPASLPGDKADQKSKRPKRERAGTSARAA